MQWSTAYKNRLPDSAFLFVAPGGHKDATGRTVPRSLRHLPIYDLKGKLDLSHVRSVLGSYGQRAHIPAWAKAEAIDVARRLLVCHGCDPGTLKRSRAARLPTCEGCGGIIMQEPATIHRGGRTEHYHPHHLHRRKAA